MQLNKALKGFLLLLPALATSACSFYTPESVNQSKIGSAIPNIEKKVNHLHDKQKVSLQMQELKKDNTIYFNLDKYEISSDFYKTLDTHATFLRNHYSYKVIVEGHADERGTPEYNIALGERRANSVVIYLQDKGVSIKQISIVSYGKEKPAVLGHDESVYAKNRRVVLAY